MGTGCGTLPHNIRHTCPPHPTPNPTPTETQAHLARPLQTEGAPMPMPSTKACPPAPPAPLPPTCLHTQVPTQVVLLLTFFKKDLLSRMSASCR
jgi:hypothetical protein